MCSYKLTLALWAMHALLVMCTCPLMWLHETCKSIALPIHSSNLQSNDRVQLGIKNKLLSTAGTNLMRCELALCRQLLSAVISKVACSTTIIIIHAFCRFGLVPAPRYIRIA